MYWYNCKGATSQPMTVASTRSFLESENALQYRRIAFCEVGSEHDQYISCGAATFAIINFTGDRVTRFAQSFLVAFVPFARTVSSRLFCTTSTPSDNIATFLAVETVRRPSCDFSYSGWSTEIINLSGSRKTSYCSILQQPSRMQRM